MQKNNKNAILVLSLVAVFFFLIVFSIVTLIGKAKKEREEAEMPASEELNEETARAELDRLLSNIQVQEVEPVKVPVDLGTTDLKDELPDINTNPITVQGYGEINIEIFSTAEKAGEGHDGWINEMAVNFNNSGYQYNGKSVSVTIRTIAAGQGVDYIISGKYLPQAFTPSNELMGEMIISEGVPCEMVSKSMVRNVAGMVISNDTYNQIMKNYDEVTIKTVTQATANNEIAMGYTNPFASSTGLNFLISTLAAYDAEDPLSETAINGFNEFQANVPFVAYTTLQMREAVSSGSLDGLIMEYQTFLNTTGLADYKFIPFGVRHDNPLYAIGNLNEEQKYTLQLFADYCQMGQHQQLAKEYGFNDPDMDTYQSDVVSLSGTEIVDAQKLWKENKDVAKPITAVFIADISGSMDGEPLNQLRSSLLNASQYINSNNSIGLISYSSDVYINLPIAEFDLNQRSYFAGAVQSLSAIGATATYDAVLVALDMLLEAREENPNTKLVMFLLSDGASNYGAELEDIRGVLSYYGIAVYSIGYNADIAELEEISNINEGTVINADSDDVIYKLKNLFNAQM